jgi:hypothetical protein
MREMKITYLKPGWYEVEESGKVYKMELIWLSRLQREIKYDGSQSPIAEWYKRLDISSRKQIKRRTKEL